MQQEQETMSATWALKDDALKDDLSIVPVAAVRIVVGRLTNGYNTPIGRACIHLAKAAGADEVGTVEKELYLAFTAIAASFDEEHGEYGEVYALAALSKAMLYGAKKYARNNWRAGFKTSRLIAASLRHLIGCVVNGEHYGGVLSGASVDDETGLDHRGHALFGISVALEQLDRGTGEQDTL